MQLYETVCHALWEFPCRYPCIHAIAAMPCIRCDLKRQDFAGTGGLFIFSFTCILGERSLHGRNLPVSVRESGDLLPDCFKDYSE